MEVCPMVECWFVIDDEDGPYVDVELDCCANISALFGNYSNDY